MFHSEKIVIGSSEKMVIGFTVISNAAVPTPLSTNKKLADFY